MHYDIRAIVPLLCRRLFAKLPAFATVRADPSAIGYVNGHISANYGHDTNLL